MDGINAKSYQSFPNLVNSGGAGGHAGDVVWMHNGLDKWTVPTSIHEVNGEAFGTHNMKHIEQYFNPETGAYDPEAYKDVPEEQYYIDQSIMDTYGLTSYEQLALQKEILSLQMEKGLNGYDYERQAEIDASVNEMLDQIRADKIRVADEVRAAAQSSDRAMLNNPQNYQFPKVGTKARELNNLINSWK